ncbi:MAG: GDYXXLXY domain-containing protein [Alcanivoracaceae bacterium]|nr:GDYXXLXY domain-containing protein [Alcanivoracaceae bacterium]
MNDIKQGGHGKRFLVPALLLVVLAQVLVLVGEWAVAHYPIWKGEPLRLRVQPVDPRDLFRGNYARLDYDLSPLPMELGEGHFDKGDVVYVRLTEAGDGGWRAASIHARPPAEKPFLRARIKRVSSGEYREFTGMDDDGKPQYERLSLTGAYHLRYGIEAWFAPKLKAQQLERDLRQGGWAVLSVADSGRAALVTVEPDNPAPTGEAGDD